MLLSAVVGCGADLPPPQVITPTPGAYRATLMGYTIQSCDEVLAQPVGVLDTTVRLTPPNDGRVTISGSRLWAYGSVALLPGSPDDTTLRQAWLGSATTQTDISGCTVQAGVTVRYFPLNTEQGSLHVIQRFSSPRTCTLHLPCDSTAVWTMERYQF